MWLKTQHEVLTVLRENDLASANEIAHELERKNDRTLRGWLDNLQELGLISGSNSTGYKLTQSGHVVASAQYVSLPTLRILWGIEEAESWLPLEVLHRLSGAQDSLTSFKTNLGQLKRNGYVSSTSKYYNGRFRAVYTLSRRGIKTLENYESLRRLR